MSYYVPDYRLEPDEEVPVCFCAECNGDIYEGDTVYKIDGDAICSDDCLQEYFRHSLQTVEKGGF